MSWLGRTVARLWSVFQQDRIRVSAEPYALLRIGAGDRITIGALDYEVFSAETMRGGSGADVRVYGLAQDGAATARLVVPIATPELVYLLAGARAGPRTESMRAVVASTIVVYPGFDP